MKRLLLVEDDHTLGLTLKERLCSEGYTVKWADTAKTAEVELSKSWDLVIFDVGLPDGSGFDLAEKWKSKVPFLFVTALSDAEHRLRGFELGAEEYIPKPFHLKELLLRVRHVLEQHKTVQLVKVQGVEINLEAMTLTQPTGEVLRPQSKDFQLLALLVQKAPNVVSRDDILNNIWGENSGNHRSVDNAIVRLRSFFPKNPIRSIRGVGYQWLGDNA